MPFQTALIQMRVIGGDKKQNLDHAETLIAQAAQNGSRLILLPEAMDLGWTHPAALEHAEPIPHGEPCRRLAQAAAKNAVYLCAGLTERDGDRVFNAAVLLGPDGTLLALHRKINELEIGHPYYALGDRLGVVPTPLGTIGLMICADGFAQNLPLSRALAYMGADIILSPAAWAVEPNHDNAKTPYGALWLDAYRPIAQDFQIWIAAVSNVGPIEAGPWAGRKCIGCSLVMAPEGRVALQGPYGADAETILYLEIEPRPRPAQGDGWTAYWKNRKKNKPLKPENPKAPKGLHTNSPG